MKVFGERLASLMDGLSQKQLAEAVGISQQTVSRYLAGRHIPDAQILIKFCRYFEVSADYLLGLKDKTDKNK